MKTIDSHQHFWHYNPDKHGWINDSMAVIRRNFLPSDLQKVLKENSVNGCVTVQADQTEKETDFLLQLAEKNLFIYGIVGWVDLRAEDATERLAYYAQFKKIKGFRHVLQSEEPEFMLQPQFLQGIKALKEFGFTFDILIFPNRLANATQLVKLNPDQPFVIDHLAKPYINKGLLDQWKHDIRGIATFKNVYCKLSGMVTEADYDNWRPSDLTPYIDVVVEAFGTSRIMFGSDWPVCLVAASYKQVLNVMQEYFSPFSQTEKELFFAGNAAAFYKL